jgi:hypothetical protein
MQAASVTITSTWCRQWLPSLMRATATSFCDVASRMRVATGRARARAQRWNTDHFALRVAFVEHRQACHMVGGASSGCHAHRQRHRVAVVHQLRNVQRDPAAAQGAPPVNWRHGWRLQLGRPAGRVAADPAGRQQRRGSQQLADAPPGS